MFTGIIEETALIKKINFTDTGKAILIKTSSNIFNEIKVGDSLAVNGVCLTLTEKINSMLRFDIVKETLKCTNLDKSQIDDYVNIERSMQASSRFDGHILQGHVETVGILVDIDTIGNSLIISIQIEKKYLKYCILKGSIALDGVSLTIAKINKNLISIALIPHTIKITSLSKLIRGSKINIETDIIAKYIENLFKLDNNKKYQKILK